MQTEVPTPIIYIPLISSQVLVRVAVHYIVDRGPVSDLLDVV